MLDEDNAAALKRCREEIAKTVWSRFKDGSLLGLLPPKKTTPDSQWAPPLERAPQAVVTAGSGLGEMRIDWSKVEQYLQLKDGRPPKKRAMRERELVSKDPKTLWGKTKQLSEGTLLL